MEGKYRNDSSACLLLPAFFLPLPFSISCICYELSSLRKLLAPEPFSAPNSISEPRVAGAQTGPGYVNLSP